MSERTVAKRGANGSSATDALAGMAHGLASTLRGRLPPAQDKDGAPLGSVVAFVAARSGEGISTVVRRTALAMTDMVRQRTLLLDLDEAGGDQAAALRKLDGGLAPDLEAPAEDAALPWRLARIPGRRLWVNDGPASPMPTMAQARIMDGGLDVAEALPALRRRFAWSLLDIPALDRSSVADRIVAEADACILVVAAESTRGMVAIALRDRVDNAGGNILGAVMTHRRFHIPERIYRWL